MLNGHKTYITMGLHSNRMIVMAVTGKDDEAILAEAERGEDVAKTAFEGALKETLPGSAMSLVQQQAPKVLAAHDEVKRLRDRDKVTK